MASFRKRGGLWEARISYYDHEKKRKYVDKGGFKTKKEAKIFSDNVQIDINTGDILTKTDNTFPEYFYKWYQVFKEPMIRDRTKSTYEYAYKVLQKFFPSKPMVDIKRQDYQEFLSTYGKNHAQATVKKCNSLYHACVKNALYEGAIKRDFIDQTTVVYDENRTRKIEYLNIDEVKQLTDHLLENLNPNYTSKYMLLTAIYTGARPGEIQGLRWSDINFNFNTISINHAWSEKENDFIPTKNKSSIRNIKVNKELLDILKTLPKFDDKDKVFINQFNTISTTTAVNRVLTKALKDLNINRKGYNLQSLRHTHVAYLLAKDVNLYAISKRLGHSDLSTTTHYYAYMIDEFKRKTDDDIISALEEITDLEDESKNDAI